MFFTQDRLILIEIEVCSQGQYTEKDYFVTLPRQTYTLVGKLNLYEEEPPDITFWELTLPGVFNIQANEGSVQLTKLVFDCLITSDGLSVGDNFFFPAHFLIDEIIQEGTEVVMIDANVISIEEIETQ